MRREIYSLSRRDDLLALMYLLIYLHDGTLPWADRYTGKERNISIGVHKYMTKAEELCKNMPLEFTCMFKLIDTLSYYDLPLYDFYFNVLDSILIKCLKKETNLSNEKSEILSKIPNSMDTLEQKNIKENIHIFNMNLNNNNDNNNSKSYLICNKSTKKKNYVSYFKDDSERYNRLYKIIGKKRTLKIMQETNNNEQEKKIEENKDVIRIHYDVINKIQENDRYLEFSAKRARKF